VKKNIKIYIVAGVIASVLIFSAIFVVSCKYVAYAKELLDIKQGEKCRGEEPGQEGREEEKEAPAIKLEVYEGPFLDCGVCYWRIRAIATGSPFPDVMFSRDDSLGALGSSKTRVNIYEPGETYILVAIAENEEGSAQDSIELGWGCDGHDEAESNTNTYSEEDLDYFFEVALGCEYGDSQPLIHKWTQDIKIKINGTPTDEDLNSLKQVIAELNYLLSDVSLDIVTDNHNIDIHFVPVEQFESILPGYVPENVGFFTVWWDSDGVIYKAVILIASDTVDQKKRSHLIREELTQSLGIMKDSYRYEDSIFYQGWTDTTNYSTIDRKIISLLYDSRIQSEMTEEQVISALSVP
jgi:hypothetical protein